MTPVATLPAANQMMEHVYKSQQRLNDLQVQLSSGQASQSYTKLGSGADRLVRMENTRDLYQRFVQNNETMDLRLETTETTLESIQKTVEDFRESLLDFSTGAMDDEVRVKDVQDAAFKQLKGLEGLLNADFDGQFLFGGSRVTTRPVDLGLTTLEDFQATFDGNASAVAMTRDANLAGVSLSAAETGDLTFDRTAGTITATGTLSGVPVGATINIGGTASNDGSFTVTGNTGTVITVQTEKLGANEVAASSVLTPPPGVSLDWDPGNLTFDEAAGTITAANADTLAGIPSGSTITIGGSASNDGVYTVGSNDGTTITIESRALTAETLTGAHAGEITVDSYYRGDDLNASHRVDGESSFSQDLNATHPAFEKAIRAMKLIAQGTFGTEGGLDHNPERIDQALHLINSAAERIVGGDKPAGISVEAGNLEGIKMEVGLQRVMIKDANERMNTMIGRLDARVAETEVVDRTQVATQLFDQANALEASLTTIARVRQLSLLKFL